MLQARGIEVGMFIMLGFEGEDESDLAATVEHLKRANPDIFLTTVAYPIKGTEFYEQVADRVRSRRSRGSSAPTATCGIAGRRSRRYYRPRDPLAGQRGPLHRARRQGSQPTGSSAACTSPRAGGAWECG